MTPPLRIGIDLGGTKIAAIALDAHDNVVGEARSATPKGDYAATLDTIRDLVRHVAASATPITVGLGIPGSISPASGRVQNANSTWLNDRALNEDLDRVLGQPVRIANDANCFALSEARDGSAAGAGLVFGVILGTGCGGALVVNGALLDGPLAISGEWGHNPLPLPTPQETPGPRCWCGRNGCMETWVSGPALTADHQRATGTVLDASAIAHAASRNDVACTASLDRLTDRLARGLAGVINLFDPDVIVLGGGLSEIATLYDDLVPAIAPHIFAHAPTCTIRPPKWGPASGVRGAARLWDL